MRHNKWYQIKYHKSSKASVTQSFPLAPTTNLHGCPDFPFCFCSVKVKLWNVETKECAMAFKGHNAEASTAVL